MQVVSMSKKSDAVSGVRLMGWMGHWDRDADGSCWVQTRGDETRRKWRKRRNTREVGERQQGHGRSRWPVAAGDNAIL